MSDSKNKYALVTKEDLSLVEDNSLNEKQLNVILSRTPKTYIKERPAKGGGKWQYVTGGYVKKCLNLMFGWDWDFEIIDTQTFLDAGEIVVKGRLTCRSAGRTIVKEQFGNKEVAFLTEWKDGQKVKTNKPLSIGNDMKAAATDALKKCASEIGIASDIYNKEDFKEVRIAHSKDESQVLAELWENFNKELLYEDDLLNIERIIDQKEKESYSKAINVLKNIQNGK